ncbi:MAG: hypothetical protein KAV87_40695 [Desulfobacteraceae bacterium]|nr:hypothetical protein [Desulfobacteraceae bacterium]
MKNLIYVVVTALLFSGCATKQVSKMPQGGHYRQLYSIQQVTNVYFDAKGDRIIIDLAVIYDDGNEEKRECLELDAGEPLRQKRKGRSFVLSEDLRTTCPGNEEVDYVRIPIQAIASRYNLRNDLDPSTPWTMKTYLRLGELYLVPADENKSVIKAKIPVEIVRKKSATYLLYPFSLAFDIVTSPVQLALYGFYYIYFNIVM